MEMENEYNSVDDMIGSKEDARNWHPNKKGTGMSNRLSDEDKHRLADTFIESYRFPACDSLGIREFAGIVMNDNYSDVFNFKRELESINAEISNLRECISLLHELHGGPCGCDFNSDICPGCSNFYVCSTYTKIGKILNG